MAGTFNEHADVGLVADTFDEIPFPVARYPLARYDAVINFPQAHMNANHVRDPATTIRAAAAWQARTAASTEAGEQFTVQFAPGMDIDIGIDGFVRHLKLPSARKDALESC